MIQVRLMQARSDYILGTYRCLFKMVVIRGGRNYPSYHFIPKVRLLIFPNKAGHHYDTGGIPAKMGTIHRGSE